MKKWMKRLLVVGAVSGGLGIGMIVAGIFMGGDNEEEKTIVFGEEEFNLTDEWQNEADEWIGQEGVWENGHVFEDICSMEIESVGMTQIVETPDLNPGQVQVVQRGEGSAYQIFEEEGSLNVLLPSHWDHKNWTQELTEKEVIIYIPEFYNFEEIEIEQVAGHVQAEQLFAGELSLKVVSGNMGIGGGQVSELETECISGSLICLAAVGQSASVENISGFSKILLEGNKDNFDYEISQGSGKILLNEEQEENYGKNWDEKSIDNGTGCQVNLDCVAGKIIVEYTDFVDLEIPFADEEEII